jgi:cell division protein ZapE
MAPFRKSSSFPTELARAASALGLELDPAQMLAATRLDNLHRNLQSHFGRGWLVRWFKPPAFVRGIYLWGGVGRGKTFLMDQFYEFLPMACKKRVHFHRLMQSVHHALARIQGEAEPVKYVAKEIAAEARVLCLDEFHITDIGDAMLMKGLLEGLLDNGVTIITTSNQEPDQLYLHGLQRARFLPAIELIKSSMDVMELDGGTDYRLRVLEHGGVYHHPLGEVTQQRLAELFMRVADGHGDANVSLEVDGRLIPSHRIATGIIWFDAEVLLSAPRGTADYIELAKRYHTVILSGLEPFTASDPDRRKRFTWLVDEFYDRRVKLIISASVPVAELLPVARDSSEVQRTESRLIQMQTHQYLSEPHLQ